MSEAFTGVIVRQGSGSDEGKAVLVASGWDVNEGRAYEVYECKYIATGINGPPPTPSGSGALVEITATNDDGVVRWRFRFETGYSEGVTGGGSGTTRMKRVRGFTAETPIYKHINFTWMFSWYGLWIDRGRLTWKSYFPGKPKLGKDADGNIGFEHPPEADFTKTSPLAGVQVFHSAKVEVEKSRVIPGRTVSGEVGFTNKPTGVGAGKKKYWVKSGIKVSPRGDNYVISEFWLRDSMYYPWPIDYAGPVDDSDDDDEEDEEEGD